MNNIFSDIPADLPDELVEILAENGAVRIERIASRGHASPGGFWYDQEENEFVLLISGGAELQFEDQDTSVRMKPGDYLVITAHQKHRVESTSPSEDTVWIAVFY